MSQLGVNVREAGVAGAWAETRSWLETAAVTLTGVAVLVLLGKGIASLGQALSLPNACWQLLALRAASVALVAGVLVRTGRESWWLFGAGYGAALMLSHASWVVLTYATLAGLAAWGSKVLLTGPRFGGAAPGGWGRVAAAWAVPLVFVVVLAGASMQRQVLREGLWTGGGAWLFDLGIRLAGAVAVLAVLAWGSAVWRGWRGGRAVQRGRVPPG
ncbi:MAG: hypothetical protein ACK4PI_08115 [Tepidisphaerales bacterium]